MLPVESIDLVETTRERLKDFLLPLFSSSRVLVLDEGTTEIIRWIGGMQYLIQEFGGNASQVHDLHEFSQASRGEGKMYTSCNEIVFLISGYIWDVESSLLNVAKAFKTHNVVVGCVLDELAHSCHPCAEQLTEDTTVSFESIAEQLKTSLDRLFRIEEQSLKGKSATNLAPIDVTVSVVPIPLHVEPLLRSSVFVMSGPSTSRVFPIQQHQLRSSGGGGLLTGLHPEKLPPKERSACKLLALSLASTLREQLQLDVAGQIYTLGPTSQLIGNTVATTLHSLSEVLAGGGNATQHLYKPASLILVDRTLDLASTARHSSTLAGKIWSCLPRTGAATGGPSSVSQAHLHDIGLLQESNKAMELGLPVVINSNSNNDNRATQRKRLREIVGAYPAVSSFSWRAPPSLCHTGDHSAELLVRDLASLPEAAGHSALCSALKSAIVSSGCSLPPQKKRGMGAELWALLSALVKLPENELAGNAVPYTACLQHRHTIQVALAAVEALQRTARNVADPSQDISHWDELAQVEKIQLQSLQDGAPGSDLLLQAAEVLEHMHAHIHPTDALLLALHATSLCTCASQGEDMSATSGALTRLGNVLRTILESSSENVTVDVTDIDDVIMRLAELPLATQTLKTAALHGSGGVPYVWGAGDKASGVTGGSCFDGMFHTLVGRLCATLLDGTRQDLPELKQAKTVNMAAVGLGLLSAGFKVLKGVNSHSHKLQTSHPADVKIIVVFVVGGITSDEMCEIRAIQDRVQGSYNIILAGTTLATPDFIAEQVFGIGT